MRYGGSSVDVLQDFTDDHNKLLSILETLIVGENQQPDDTTNDSASGDTGAAFGQDNGEFNLFNTDRQLSALQTAAKMLGRLSEARQCMQRVLAIDPQNADGLRAIRMIDKGTQ